MTTPLWVRAYRVFFGLLALWAVIYQAYYLHDHDTFNAGNYFSFFTIQSNIFGALVLLWGATPDPERRDPETVDLIRGAAALYLSITGLVVVALLRGMQEDLAVPIDWVDGVTHEIMPIVMVVDWMLVSPRTRLDFRRALIWLAYPLVYVAYSLIRGPIVDWYPYPFLNPDAVGNYGGVALYCVGIAVGAALFAWLVVFLGNQTRQPAPA